MEEIITNLIWKWLKCHCTDDTNYPDRLEPSGYILLEDKEIDANMIRWLAKDICTAIEKEN